MDIEQNWRKVTHRRVILSFLLCTCFFIAGLYFLDGDSSKLESKALTSTALMQKKLLHITGISQNIRHRTYALLQMINEPLLQMINEQDPFIVDSLEQDLFHYAFLFRSNRDELKALALNQPQQESLKALFHLTAKNSVNQLSVVNLISHQDKARAAKLLFSTAIPKQKAIKREIKNFIHLSELEHDLISTQVRSKLDRNQLAFTSLIIAASLCIFAALCLLRDQIGAFKAA